MNIFAVDEDPKQAAMALCDKHVVKMILESTQMLSTVAQLRGFEGPYRITHAKHPCTLWTAKHPANWNWLVCHATFLCYEYTDRYHKQHKCHSLIELLAERSRLIWSGQTNHWGEHTPFAQCMPDEYKRPDPVAAYRAYYIGEKARIATWKLNKPEWFTQGAKNVQR